VADPVKGQALAGLANAARALGSRNYRNYIIGNGVSLCGTWMQKVGVGWLAWQLTHSGTWLGILATGDLLATVTIAPFSGAVADRIERLPLARQAQLAATVQGVLLAALTATGLVTIYWLFALNLLMAAINAVDGTTRLALVPSLVSRPALASALAINSIVFNLARFIGPIAAGLAIAHGGVALAFALNAASYVWFFGALLTVRVEQIEGANRDRGLLRATVEGCLYAARHPGIGPLLLLLGVNMVALRSVLDLLPGFADAVFGRGAQGLAWLIAVTGLGAIVAGLYLVRRTDTRGQTRVVMLCLIGGASAMAVFAASHYFWLGMLALFCSGFCQVMVGVSGQTLIQTSVDPGVRGRVMSLYGMINRAGPALGTLIMGLFSGAFGLQLPVLGAALLVGLYWLWARLRARRMAEALERDAAA
jgi:MFS family permease